MSNRNFFFCLFPIPSFSIILCQFFSLHFWKKCNFYFIIRFYTFEQKRNLEHSHLFTFQKTYLTLYFFCPLSVFLFCFRCYLKKNTKRIFNIKTFFCKWLLSSFLYSSRQKNKLKFIKQTNEYLFNKNWQLLNVNQKKI